MGCRGHYQNIFFSWLVVFLSGGLCARALDLRSNTADVIYQKDGLISDMDWPSIYAKGDYNGDGYKDVVMKWRSYPDYWKALVIPGGPNVSGGLAEERAVTTLSVEGAVSPGFYSADLDNDGRDDMILIFSVFTSGQYRHWAEIYYGSDPLRSSINLGTNPEGK